MTFFNLVVITFDITLYIVDQHEIGRNSLILVGFSTFGISVTVVQLIGWYISPVSKNFKIACMISSPTIGHVLLKNTAFSPSTPRAFRSLMLCKVVFTSIFVTWAAI